MPPPSKPFRPARPRQPATTPPDVLFDVANLGQLVREYRGALSIRAAARAADVSFSTLARVEGGAHPDLATFTKLCKWLGVPPSRFFSAIVEKEESPFEDAITHLQSDPALTDESAAKITDMMRTMYQALAQRVVQPEPVACHLRATSVMRPGVPHRLATLLEDMHRKLEARVSAGDL